MIGPPKLPNFQPIIQVYFDEMFKLAQQLFALFVKVLNQDNHSDSTNSNHIIRYDTPMSSFNLVRYPASNDQSGGLGISDHTDWELFTLLYPSFYPFQQNVPNYTGLEVWFENQWIQVPRLPGTIIVNQGEMLSRFSNGRFRAPVHRVVARNQCERYSLVSFWAPNYETLLPDNNVASKHIFCGEHYLIRNNIV